MWIIYLFGWNDWWVPAKIIEGFINVQDVYSNDSKKKKKKLVFTCNYDDSNCTFNLYIIIHCLPNCYSMIYYLPRSPLLVNSYNSQYCHQTQQCEQCCSYCHCNPNQQLCNRRKLHAESQNKKIVVVPMDNCTYRPLKVAWHKSGWYCIVGIVYGA